jgi:outer membrane murein-binding lipoprotein Lpp
VNELTISQEASSLVAQYKNIIREQDHKIQTLNEQVKQLQLQNESISVKLMTFKRKSCENYFLLLYLLSIYPQSKLTETQTSMSQINDQNILLRAQLTAASSGVQNQQSNMNGFPDQHATKIHELEQQVSSLTHEKSHNETKIQFYEAENARLLTEIDQFRATKEDESTNEKLKCEINELNSKVEQMSKDQEDLLELLADQDVRIKEYRKRLKNLGQQVEGDDEDD